ncbi:MAG: hypothetical protein SynsKO_26420 [Synoicihabitans sp.]
MAIWEYKVISSGKGGFASPQLLENFLNDLGKDEWEIIDYRVPPDNPLAFSGLARRTTQRDWTLEAEAAAQARDEERRKREEVRRKEEERIEKAAKEAEAEREAAIAAKESGEDGLRTVRDTERDDDPEALAEEAAGIGLDEWDELDMEDDLPTLLDAVRPHLRRNQRGPGEAAAIDYLAKRWDQEPDDVIGALVECGFTVPENDESLPDYFEFEGDLFWLNCNNRGQLFLNVREKPRAKFKSTKMKKVDADDPSIEDVRSEHESELAEKKKKAEEKAARKAAEEAEAAKPADPLPEGLDVLNVLKPKMRRNRRGPGFSGSVSFLAKALKHSEETIMEALKAIGLTLPEDRDAKPNFVEAEGQLYWLKQDNRGGVWINCRDQDKAKAKAKPQPADESESAGSESDAADKSSPGESTEITFAPGANAVPALRLLLKPKSRGVGVSGEIGKIADELNKPAVEILEVLVKAGLNVPENADEKPKFIELGDEILWLNRNAKDDSLWLNAKVKPKRKTAAKKTTTKKVAAKKAPAKKAATKKTTVKKTAAEKADSTETESADES